MTTLALAERIADALTGAADHLETSHEDGKVVHHVSIGKQLFIVTCEELAADKPEPTV